MLSVIVIYCSCSMPFCLLFILFYFMCSLLLLLIQYSACNFLTWRIALKFKLEVCVNKTVVKNDLLVKWGK
jgi:hypothetical protein